MDNGMTNLASLGSVLELFQGYPVPSTLIVTGVLTVLLGLGIRIAGFHMAGHFKPRWALMAGSALLVLGVTMELLTRDTPNPENSSTNSGTESDDFIFEEKTVLSVPGNSRMGSTKRQVEKELKQKIETEVSEFIAKWMKASVGQHALASDITQFMWDVLEAPTITTENRSAFGNRSVVYGHATLVVEELKLYSIVILSMKSEEIDATSSTKPIRTRERPERESKLASGEWPPM